MSVATLMNRWSLKNDTQRVKGVIKRRNIYKQFVRQPVILIICTELKTWLLLIFSHQVQPVLEEVLKYLSKKKESSNEGIVCLG